MASNNFIIINKNESASFEILKLILLCEVIIGHALALCLPEIKELGVNSFLNVILVGLKVMFSFGRESAFLFIFLSGFFTSKIFISSNSEFNIKSVIVKRIKRIYPTFTLALLLTLFLDFLGIYIFEYAVYRNNYMHYVVNDHLNISIFIKNFFSLQPTFSETFGSNGPLWTLGYLIQFFLLATFIKFISKNSRYIFNLICLVSGCILFVSLGAEFSMLFLVWVVGVNSRYVVINPKINNITWLLTAILSILLISKLSPKFVSIVLSPIIGLTLLHLIKNVAKRNFNQQIQSLSNLPDISYTLYATHMPILFFLFGMFSFYFKEVVFINFVISYLLCSLLFTVVVSFLIIKSTSKRLVVNA